MGFTQVKPTSFKEVSAMLCLRVSLGDKFLGIFRKEDRSMVRSLVAKFGNRLAIVPVVVL